MEGWDRREVFGLVNALYELAELSPGKRQLINDEADELAFSFISKILAKERERWENEPMTVERYEHVHRDCVAERESAERRGEDVIWEALGKHAHTVAGQDVLLERDFAKFVATILSYDRKG